MTVLTSVVRSMVENVSSPTLLMREVMISVRDVVVRDVVVRDVVVVAAFAVPAMTDTPLIPVTSNAVIARTESFLRFIICFHRAYRRVEIYGMFHPAIFSRLDIIEIGNPRKARFSDPDMSWDDTLTRCAESL